MDKKYKTQREARKQCMKCNRLFKVAIFISVTTNVVTYIWMKHYYNKYINEKEIGNFRASRAPYKVE